MVVSTSVKGALRLTTQEGDTWMVYVALTGGQGALEAKVVPLGRKCGAIFSRTVFVGGA